MTQDRRTFLKTTALGRRRGGGRRAVHRDGAAGAEGRRRPAGRWRAASCSRPCAGQNGFGLGVRTDRGVLDVAAAEQDLKEGAPTTITDVFDGKGDLEGLRRLTQKAKDSHFVAIDKATFGPCVTHPEKIICVGLNYRKHAAETGNPVPKAPILFNKFNTALNHHGGVIGVSEEDAHALRLRGRAGDRHRQDRAQCQRGRRAGRDLRLRHRQRLHGARPAVALDPMDARQEPRRLGADRPVAGHLRPRRRRQSEDRVPGERRGAPVVEHVRHGVQLQAARRYASRYFTLKPGDIIFTGTPEGVISGYPKDKQVWLKAGDKLVTSIEKLGDLEFKLT